MSEKPTASFCAAVARAQSDFQASIRAAGKTEGAATEIIASGCGCDMNCRVSNDKYCGCREDARAVLALRAKPEAPPDTLEPHSCMACPVEVRDLSATAHNAVLAIEAARNGHGDWARAYRKVNDLAESLARFQPIVDTHFAAIKREAQ